MSKEKDSKLIKTLVLIAAVVISLASVVFAQIKANEAERNAFLVVKQRALANQGVARAETLHELAQKSASDARAAEAEALKILDLLNECQNKK